jgi:DNA-binding beta-propeller fold protein YncE
MKHLKKNLLSGFVVLTATALICFPVSPAYAYKVTRLKHLFDLEYRFLQPSDVAVGADHLIYVVDGVNNRVVVFDESGKLSFSFGNRGSGRGQFNAPLGITTDRSGNVYVADTGNRRVQIFTARGNCTSIVPVAPAAGENPADPVDCAVDDKRQRLYVVDNDNHHLLVYSLTDCKLLERWGSEGDGTRDFRYPFLTAVGADTAVLVVDVLNTRVQVWSPQGEVISTIGAYGVDLGQLYRPKGVCMNGENTVFVSDSYLGVIQTFNRFGHFQSVAADEDRNIVQWTAPVGITIDDRQNLYVVEMLANRVRVYHVMDTVERDNYIERHK